MRWNWMAAALVALTLTGCGKPDPTPSPSPTALKTYGQIDSAHTFTERSGQPLAVADLRGKPWIASFIFTRCGGPCPRISAQVAKLQATLGDVPDLRFVSFSVDPEYDTPEVLRTYAAEYGADSTRWLFVTGDRAEIFRMANLEFKLGAGDAAGNPPGIDLSGARDPATSVPHSTRLALVDRDGYIRAYRDALDPAAVEQLVADVRTLTGSERSK